MHLCGWHRLAPLLTGSQRGSLVLNIVGCAAQLAPRVCLLGVLAGGGGAASDEESRRSYGSTASTTAPVTAPSNRSLPMVTPMGSTTPVPLAPIHAGDTEEEEEGADDVDLDLAGASPGGGGRPQATPATGAAPVAGEQHGAAPRGVVGHGDEALGASRRSISSSDRRGATASGTNTVLEVEVGQVRRTVVPSSGSDGADGGAGGGASARNRHLSRREFIPLPLETKDAGSEEAKGRESSFTTFRGPSYINESVAVRSVVVVAVRM